MGPDEIELLIDEDHIECDDCEGTGKLSFLVQTAKFQEREDFDSETVPCDKCEGSGKILIPEPSEAWKHADLV